MARPMITFTSDFGHSDWFVGVVRGVIHGICADARIVDLTHDITPGDLARAAFVLEAASVDFPPGTVHLAVVDPGVGTQRRALAVRARGQLFVGPDNGVLDWALRDPRAEVRALTEVRFFRPPVSRTFHGRDVFAPVAAHLAAGAVLEQLGPAVPDPVRLERPEPLMTGGVLTGRVLYMDRFGNALTDLHADVIERAFPGVPLADLEVEVVDRQVKGIAETYGDAAIGTLVALMGSSGRLELAEVGGMAGERYGIGLRDTVRVRVKA